jgi:hypothetical protein
MRAALGECASLRALEKSRVRRCLILYTSVRRLLKNVREQRSCESETDFEEPESNSREPGADQGESGNDQKESSCDSEEPEADFGGGQEVTGARAGLGIGQFPQLS